VSQKLTISQTLTLNTGTAIPVFGFGTWKLQGVEATQAVLWALQAGYRLLDTASIYGNETEVGEAVRQSGLARSEIFVTTKLWPTNFFRVETAFSASLKRLGLSYVDLYLIHWPRFGRNKAWQVLEKIYDQGLAKAIGVSNYSVEDLEDLFKTSRVVPAVNQVEFSPFAYRQGLMDYCRDKGIVLEAYSPLTRGHNLGHPIIRKLAERYRKTGAQTMLRWSLQHGLIVIPKSSRKERIAENAAIFDFEISPEDVVALDALGPTR
jgi:diketogulonate reductase-like aldo/keto reductase